MWTWIKGGSLEVISHRQTRVPVRVLCGVLGHLSLIVMFSVVFPLDKFTDGGVGRGRGGGGTGGR